MRYAIPIADIEQYQKFDGALVQLLAKVIEFLPNIED